MKIIIIILLLYKNLKASDIDKEFEEDLSIIFKNTAVPNLKEKNIRNECKYLWIAAKIKAQNGEIVFEKYHDKLMKSIKAKIDKDSFVKQDSKWYAEFLNQMSQANGPIKNTCGYLYHDTTMKILKNPNSMKADLPIGTTLDKSNVTLSYVSELNLLFNKPLVSLSRSDNEDKIYATLVFKMQDFAGPLAWVADRRVNDHSGVVFEYFQDGEWEAVYVDYRRDSFSGKTSGENGDYIVETHDKNFIYNKILWNSELKKEDFANPTPTQVDYFRYATFIFPNNTENQKKIKNIEHNTNFSRKRGYGNNRYECSADHKYCCHPLHYSSRGKRGYDNCCTYAARLIALFGSEPNELHAPVSWPQRSLNKEDYSSVCFFEVFDANTLRKKVEDAYKLRPEDIIICTTGIHKDVLDLKFPASYLVIADKPRKMHSLPYKLCAQYLENKNSLRDLKRNIDSESRESIRDQNIEHIIKVHECSLITARAIKNPTEERKPKFLVEGVSTCTDPLIKHHVAEFAEDIRRDTQRSELNIAKEVLSGIPTKGMELFSSALCDNKKIKSLNLSENSIDSEFLKHFKYVFSLYNQTITNLNLENNQINSEGAKILSTIIRRNNTLEILNINSNCVGDEGVAYLSASLKHNFSMKEINLENNSITNVGAEYLRNTVHYQNKSLTVISLKGNDIGDAILGEIKRLQMLNAQV